MYRESFRLAAVPAAAFFALAALCAFLEHLGS